MAPNFILAAAASLLIYSGWKGASLLNVLRGGEADQTTTKPSSGTASPGGVGVPGEGSEANGGAGAAGTPPTSLPPSPLGIAKGRIVASINPSKVEQVRAGLKVKERLEANVKNKIMTRGEANYLFAQWYPHYAKQTEELKAGLKNE